MRADNTRFNPKVYIISMYFEDALIPHMLGDETNFSAAQFVHPLTTESVWETILTLWAAVYTGLPSILVFDDGSQLIDTLVDIYEIHNFEWQRSGTQHHSVSGIEERYHETI